MIVDLRPLRAERGATLLVTCHESVASQIPDIPFGEPVSGELTLCNLGSVLRVTGRIRTDVELICDRCARPFRHRLEAGVDEDIDWSGGSEFIGGDGAALWLDVGALAREMLVVALPMVALCDEACAGLCDRCGADLSAGACACRAAVPDPRLEPLTRFKDAPRE
jgi:uncharacterized protein